MIAWTRRNMIRFSLCGMLMALGGCAKSFKAREYPAFYDSSLRTVAIVPFRNQTYAPGAGLLVAQDMAMALRVNGTYSVLPPRRLESLLREKKLPELSRTDSAKNAETLRKLGSVQAFIMGRVLYDSSAARAYPADYRDAFSYAKGNIFLARLRYQLVDDDEEGEGEGDEGEEGEDFDGDFGPDYGYGWGYPYYYYPEYMAEATVAVEVSMIRVSDGQVLYTTPGPIEGHADIESWHHIAPVSATLDAAHRAVVKAVRDIAAVPVTVTVDPHNDIRTAAGKTDGKWDYRDTFGPSDARMYVVLQLPPTVGHDAFRVTITPRGNPGDVVATKDVVWPVGATVHGIEFSPKEIAARKGPGPYTANFYARGQQVMQRDFKIE